MNKLPCFCLIIIAIILLNLLLISLPSNVYAQYDEHNTFSTGNKIYISFDISFFLPVITTNIRVNFRINDNVGWGVGINFFFVAGYSINLEAFMKFSVVNNTSYEFPISIGLVIGGGEEGSLGPTPDKMFGIGLHFIFEPVVLKLGNFGISLLNIGGQIITNFNDFAFTLYFGNGFRYYFDS